MKLASSILACLFAAVALAACGGSSSKPSAAAASPHEEPSGGDVVQPETMDEIRRALDRKRNVVARCLGAAVDSGELPKNAHGRITLGFVISPAGKAQDIKVIKASLSSKTLTECVVEHVGEIEFPTLAEPLPWSYTYGFEAT